MDRHDVAWLIYCWQQGYKKPEDREGLGNWMRDPDSHLTDRDIADRDACLEIADSVIQVTLESVEGSALDAEYYCLCHGWRKLTSLTELCEKTIAWKWIAPESEKIRFKGG